MDKKTVDKIFDPFFTTKEAGKGTGLGLAISQNIAKDHHGQLTVSNHPTGGAVFCLTLPYSDSNLFSTVSKTVSERE